MTVFKPEGVIEQPLVEMSHWSFRTVADDSGYKTKHMVGIVDGFGRVSSPIEDVIEGECVKTSSGRIYKLIGSVGQHMDSEYVFSIWREVNQVWEVAP